MIRFEGGLVLIPYSSWIPDGKVNIKTLFCCLSLVSQFIIFLIASMEPMMKLKFDKEMDID